MKANLEQCVRLVGKAAAGGAKVSEMLFFPLFRLRRSGGMESIVGELDLGQERLPSLRQDFRGW